MTWVALLALVGCAPKGQECGPALTVTPASVDLGAVAIGASQAGSVTVGNDCSPPLHVEGAIAGDPAFSLVNGTADLDQGESVALTLRFTAPDDAGHSAVLTLTPSAGDPVDVVLSANGGSDTDASGDDADGDGHLAVAAGGDDCDDTDPDVHPGAADGAGLVDDDCDGLVDEDAVVAGDVVVDELMIDPAAVADAQGEWLELVNLSARDVDLVGWTLDSGLGPVAIDESLVLAPGDRAVVAASGYPSVNGGVSADVAVGGALPLDNASGWVTLAVAGTTVATASWGPGWPVGTGASMSLSPTAGAANVDDPAMWCVSSSALPAGDHGTPGAVNDVCVPGDVDNDGWTVAEGDCADDDPRVHPGATEVWGDLVDDDCDGKYETSAVTSLSSAYVDGQTRTYPDHLGFRSNLAIGDVDGDGMGELVAASWYGDDDQGVVYVLDGAKWTTWAAKAPGLAQATAHGDVARHDLGGIGAKVGDVTGDGMGDLVVGGHDGYGGFALAVWKGGATLTGNLVDGAATLTMSGSLSADRADVASAFDLTGDGVDEVVYAEGRAHDGTHDYNGRVAILDPSGLTGNMPVASADSVLWGTATYDYLGETVGGGDLDGDGYDDLVIGAWGDDEGGSSAGAFYVVKGGGLPPSGTIDGAYDAKVYDHLLNRRLGGAGEPVVTDLDGDGATDLAVGQPVDGQVEVFFGAGALSGKVSDASADLVVAGVTSSADPIDFGLGLCAGDFTGDGVDDLAVGAPDDDTEYPSAAATHVGDVTLYDVADLAAAGRTKATKADARATVTGASIGDGFGQTLVAGDLDADGDDELAIDAPGVNSDQGRVYLLGF